MFASVIDLNKSNIYLNMAANAWVCDVAGVGGLGK